MHCITLLLSLFVPLNAVHFGRAAFASTQIKNEFSLSSSITKSTLFSTHNDISQDDSSSIDRRRAILNIILTSGMTLTTSGLPAHAFSFGSSSPATKEIKPTTAVDIAGSPIIAQTFLSKKNDEDRIMVQGLKGDPTYLIVKMEQDQLQIESYALNAECTHLGCVVPWDPTRGKFVCPCHGSQYNKMGEVLRGPAPGSLKLAKVYLEEETGKVLLEPWTGVDFRSGEKPWWM